MNGLIGPAKPDGFCGINKRMNRQEILDRLRENEHALRERGVTHAALFGSRARGDNRPDSDIDIMIEIEPGKVEDLYTYVGLKSYIASLFSDPVDVVDRQALKPRIRPPAEGDAVYAF
jgi:predicted nucleotidyltransferase